MNRPQYTPIPRLYTPLPLFIKAGGVVFPTHLVAVDFRREGHATVLFGSHAFPCDGEEAEGLRQVFMSAEDLPHPDLVRAYEPSDPVGLGDPPQPEDAPQPE